jgi:hypothetical protein
MTSKVFASAIPGRFETRTSFFEVTILSMTRRPRSSQPQPSLRILRAAVAMLVVVAPFATSQTAPNKVSATDVTATDARLELPDSPGFLASSSMDTPETPANSGDASFDPSTTATRVKRSAHFQMTIAPNEIAEPMTVSQKVVGGLKDSVSLFSAAGWFVSAGWEQLTNGSPNYGTDRGAFGQRLGAAAVRNISEGVLSDCLFAPVFHEDPRYYIMGKGHNFFKRAIYAGTRTIITRTDSGRTMPNFALLAGNAAGSALTIPYYPAKNTTFSEVAQTFGGSIGGSALGFVVTEFISDALEFTHIKKSN